MLQQITYPLVLFVWFSLTLATVLSLSTVSWTTVAAAKVNISKIDKLPTIQGIVITIFGFSVITYWKSHQFYRSSELFLSFSLCSVAGRWGTFGLYPCAMKVVLRLPAEPLLEQFRCCLVVCSANAYLWASAGHGSTFVIISITTNTCSKHLLASLFNQSCRRHLRNEGWLWQIYLSFDQVVNQCFSTGRQR